MTKPTYEELEVRCAQLQMIADLNRCTVIAQQIAYNEHIKMLEQELRRRNGRGRRARRPQAGS